MTLQDKITTVADEIANDMIETGDTQMPELKWIAYTLSLDSNESVKTILDLLFREVQTLHYDMISA